MLFLRVLQRERDPPAQHARPHRADRAVNHIEEAFAVLSERMEQLEIADGEFVEAHERVLLYSAKA